MIPPKKLMNPFDQDAWSSCPVNTISSPELSGAGGSRIPPNESRLHQPRKGILKRPASLRTARPTDSSSADALAAFLETDIIRRDPPAIVAIPADEPSTSGINVPQIIQPVPVATAAAAADVEAEIAPPRSNVSGFADEVKWVCTNQSVQRSQSFTLDPPDPGSRSRHREAVHSDAAESSSRSPGRPYNANNRTAIGGLLQPSRIPRLSVTWWETSSVAGDDPPNEARRCQRNHGAEPQKLVRSPEIEEEVCDFCEEAENADPNADQQSAAGDARDDSCPSEHHSHAHWPGKSTRYVHHCDKRHHSADQQSQEEYLTPTQRKNRTINELRKQEKHLQRLLEEKELHIDQLRNRMTELELVLQQGGLLNSDCQQFLQKLKENDQKWLNEQQALQTQYEDRIQSLLQQLTFKNAVNAAEDEQAFRQDNFREDRGEDAAVAQRQESQVKLQLTSPSPTAELANELSANLTRVQEELSVYQFECFNLKSRLTDAEFRLQKYDNSAECNCRACANRTTDLSNQLEACKLEATSWREKAAEMQLSLQRQLQLSAEFQPSATAVVGLPPRPVAENSERRRYSADAQVLTIESTEQKRLSRKRDQFSKPRKAKRTISKESSSEESEAQKASTPKQHRRGHSTEFVISRKRSEDSTSRDRLEELQNENEKLRQDNEALQASEEDILRELDVKREQLETSYQKLQALEREIAMRRTEAEVAELTLHRMRDTNLNQAELLRSLEEKVVTLDTNETPEGVPIPRVKMARFKCETLPKFCQTELKGDEIQACLEGLPEAELKLQQVEASYQQEVLELNTQLADALTDLNVNANAVSVLGSQLSAIQAEFEETTVKWEEQRQEWYQHLMEQTSIASRVPFLEEQLVVAKDEVKQLNQQLDAERQEFEQGLEDSLSGSLKSQKTAVDYWKHKLRQAEAQMTLLRDNYEKMVTELQDTKMRLNLEKTELLQKLQSSLSCQENLHARVYASRESREVQTCPFTEDKAVTAMPLILHKLTGIVQGDLFDERDEQLKLSQGELLTTRRQVEILQAKIRNAEGVHQNIEESDLQNKDLREKLEATERSLEDVRSQRLLETAEFQRELSRLKREKDEMKAQEKQKLLTLEGEFKILQKELENVVRSYEAEKQQLKQTVQRMMSEKSGKPQDPQDPVPLQGTTASLSSWLLSAGDMARQPILASTIANADSGYDRGTSGLTFGSQQSLASSGRYLSKPTHDSVESLVQRTLDEVAKECRWDLRLSHTPPGSICELPDEDEALGHLTQESIVFLTAEFAAKTAICLASTLRSKRNDYVVSANILEPGYKSRQTIVGTVTTTPVQELKNAEDNEDVGNLTTLASKPSLRDAEGHRQSQDPLQLEIFSHFDMKPVMEEFAAMSSGSREFLASGNSTTDMHIVPIQLPVAAAYNFSTSYGSKPTTRPLSLHAAAKPTISENRAQTSLSDAPVTKIEKLEAENRELTERNQTLFEKYIELEDKFWALTTNRITSMSGEVETSESQLLLNEEFLTPTDTLEKQPDANRMVTSNYELSTTAPVGRTGSAKRLLPGSSNSLFEVLHKIARGASIEDIRAAAAKQDDKSDASRRSPAFDLEQELKELTQWLDGGLEQEVGEMEHVRKWYETDKLKMQATIDNLQSELENLAGSKESYSAKLEKLCSDYESLLRVHQELCAELELYKSEESSAHPPAQQSTANTEKPECQSDSCLTARSRKDAKPNVSPLSDPTDAHVTQLLRESVELEKRVRATNSVNHAIQSELDMLKGDLEITKAHYLTEREKLIHRIEELTGEAWSTDELDTSADEASKTKNIKTSKTKLTWELLELREAFAEKQRELAALQQKYHTDVLTLQEKIYVTKARRVRSTSISSTDTRSAQDGYYSTTTDSSDCAKRQLDMQSVELQKLANELHQNKAKSEAAIKLLQAQLKSSKNAVQEREVTVRILERELKSYEEGMTYQRLLYENEIKTLKEKTGVTETVTPTESSDETFQSVMKEIAEQQPSAFNSLAKGDPAFAVEAAEVERIWKAELKKMRAFYQSEIKQLKQLLFVEKSVLENRAKTLHEKFTNLRTVVDEKENCIRILDRELRSAADGLEAQKQKYEAEIEKLQAKLLRVEERVDNSFGKTVVTRCSTSGNEAAVTAEPKSHATLLKQSRTVGKKSRTSETDTTSSLETAEEEFLNVNYRTNDRQRSFEGLDYGAPATAKRASSKRESDAEQSVSSDSSYQKKARHETLKAVKQQIHEVVEELPSEVKTAILHFSENESNADSGSLITAKSDFGASPISSPIAHEGDKNTEENRKLLQKLEAWEDKYVSTDKELSMATHELDVCRRTLAALAVENNVLKQKMQENNLRRNLMTERCASEDNFNRSAASNLMERQYSCSNTRTNQ